MAGKGQFTCGAKSCSKVESLETYEVPFKYVEAEREKQALVKVGGTFATLVIRVPSKNLVWQFIPQQC